MVLLVLLAVVGVWWVSFGVVDFCWCSLVFEGAWWFSLGSVFICLLCCRWLVVPFGFVDV